MGRRPRRVGELIQRELGQMFSLGRVKDPDIGMVTVTAVDMSPDLRQAKIYYSVYDQEPEACQQALDRVRSFVRRELGHALRLKRTPELTFVYDDSLDRADRIEALLRDARGAAIEPGSDDDEDQEGREVQDAG